MDESSVPALTLQFIREFIPERNHVNVISVARVLVILENLQFIEEVILERNHVNVISVASPLI